MVIDLLHCYYHLLHQIDDLRGVQILSISDMTTATASQFSNEDCSILASSIHLEIPHSNQLVRLSMAGVLSEFVVCLKTSRLHTVKVSLLQELM
jgi:hypothetical protein